MGLFIVFKGKSKKYHLVCWEVCFRPKEDKGLGLGSLVSKNISLVAKWVWWFLFLMSLLPCGTG